MSKRQSAQPARLQSPSVSAFEAIKQINDAGEEYWSARELAKLLGYSASWQNFERVIEEAMDVCRASGGDVERLFNAIEGVSKPGKWG